MDLSLIKQNKKVNAQSERFEETARELECDEDEDRFNETLKRIAPKPGETASVKPTSDQRHDPPD